MGGRNLNKLFGEQGHGFSRITSPDKLTEGEEEEWGAVEEDVSQSFSVGFHTPEHFAQGERMYPFFKRHHTEDALLLQPLDCQVTHELLPTGTANFVVLNNNLYFRIQIRSGTAISILQTIQQQNFHFSTRGN